MLSCVADVQVPATGILLLVTAQVTAVQTLELTALRIWLPLAALQLRLHNRQKL